MQERGDFRRYARHKLVVLMEEVGEASKACLEYDWENFRDELVQVAAVAVAMVEGYNSSIDQGVVA